MRGGERHIGTAGWAIPSLHAADFPTEGSQLERYGSRLSAVEINSSFTKSHRRFTYEKWARSVRPEFRFSVKIPKVITHNHGLVDVDNPLSAFANEVAGLGEKLGVVLVQLPPKLALDAQTAEKFFHRARTILSAAIVIEPRHSSWFSAEADGLLQRLNVARVAAHPVLHGNGEPGGWDGLQYFRLHGTPKTYYSDYDQTALHHIAERLDRKRTVSKWCIFDNTAAGAALGNALSIMKRALEPRTVWRQIAVDTK